MSFSDLLYDHFSASDKYRFDVSNVFVELLGNLSKSLNASCEASSRKNKETNSLNFHKSEFYKYVFNFKSVKLLLFALFHIRIPLKGTARMTKISPPQKGPHNDRTEV